MTFGESAVRCWSLAAQVLGWRPVEFWSSTPAEVAASLRSLETAIEPVAPELLTELLQRFPD